MYTALFNGSTVKTTVTLPDVPGASRAHTSQSHRLIQLSLPPILRAYGVYRIRFTHDYPPLIQLFRCTGNVPAVCFHPTRLQSPFPLVHIRT